MSYYFALMFGEEEEGELPDDISQAQAWLEATVLDLRSQGYLQGWRALGLMEQVRNMPRAGFTFKLDSIGLIGAERRRR